MKIIFPWELSHFLSHFSNYPKRHYSPLIINSEITFFYSSVSIKTYLISNFEAPHCTDFLFSVLISSPCPESLLAKINANLIFSILCVHFLFSLKTYFAAVEAITWYLNESTIVGSIHLQLSSSGVWIASSHQSCSKRNRAAVGAGVTGAPGPEPKDPAGALVPSLSYCNGRCCSYCLCPFTIPLTITPPWNNISHTLVVKTNGFSIKWSFAPRFSKCKGND